MVSIIAKTKRTIIADIDASIVGMGLDTSVTTVDEEVSCVVTDLDASIGVASIVVVPILAIAADADILAIVTLGFCLKSSLHLDPSCFGRHQR